MTGAHLLLSDACYKSTRNVPFLLPVRSVPMHTCNTHLVIYPIACFCSTHCRQSFLLRRRCVTSSPRQNLTNRSLNFSDDDQNLNRHQGVYAMTVYVVARVRATKPRIGGCWLDAEELIVVYHFSAGGHRNLNQSTKRCLWKSVSSVNESRERELGDRL